MKWPIHILITIVLVWLLAQHSVFASDSTYEDSSCVEYEREAELYLVKNDCPGAGDGCTRQLLTFEEAVTSLRKYRWIDISASMKRPGHALWEAELKLIGTSAEALVMIYLPQGIDKIYCDNSVTGIAWLIDALKLYWGENYPVDHPRFQETFSNLIQEVTKDGLNILVTSKSYGAHQALEAVYNNSRVFHLSIGPSFGIFKDTSGDRVNPHVHTYVENLSKAICKECILTSFNDCWSLYAFGGAMSLKDERSFSCDDYKNPEHPSPHMETNSCPENDYPCRIYGNYEVYDAIHANSKNVKTVNVTGASHYTPSYYDHGLIDAMRKCPKLFDLEFSIIDDILNGKHPNNSRLIPPIIGMVLN